MIAGDCMAVALSEELDEMKAAPPARNRSRAVAGLTVVKVSCGRMQLLRWRGRTSQGH